METAGWIFEIYLNSCTLASLKTIAAILLTSLLLFNLCGYRIVSAILQSHADNDLEASLDNNKYDNSELIRVTVPISNPYLHQQSGLERVDGEVSIKGVQYKYVQRSIHIDSITYICIPNHAKMHAKRALHRYFSEINDLTHHGDGKSKKTVSHLKYLFSEFEMKRYEWNMAPMPLQNRVFCANQEASFPDQFNLLPSQPPEMNLLS